jgi:hypothetical protein
MLPFGMLQASLLAGMQHCSSLHAPPNALALLLLLLLLQAFVNLECPTALALLHINSSRAAPRLHAPALRAVLRAAQRSAERPQEQLRRLYAMPQLQLSSNDTLMQLLGRRWVWQQAAGPRGGSSALTRSCQQPACF